ncbi:hypothetical protein D3C85_333750 [compost metagenome]
MNAIRHSNEHLMPALTYANRQIDNFSQRKRLTFTELALIVEAIYTMCNISGSLVLAYALLSRAKCLVLDEHGYFTLHDSTDTKIDHIIPSFLRDLPFYMDHKVKYEQLDQFVPLFALHLGADTVVLKNTIWVRSRERNDIHLPILLGSQAVSAAQVENKHASVVVPVVHLIKDVPACSLLQLPATTFDKVYAETKRGIRVRGEDKFALKLTKGHGRSSHPETSIVDLDPRLERANVHNVVGQFWGDYEAYAKKIALQNANMPKHVIEAVTHTLINTQKKPGELSALIF